MSDGAAMLCKEMKHRAVLYACDELETPARAAIEEHAAECAECAALLVRERELWAILAAQPAEEPSAVLLAQCRGELSDALDELVPKGLWQRFTDALRPKKWFALRPAWGAALCLLLGIALGVGVPRWLKQGVAEPTSGELVRARIPLSEQDLQSVNLAGLRVLPTPDASGANVEFQLRREQPFVVRGSVDDEDVRSWLIHVMQSRRFDSGLRMDSLDALRTRASDEQVRAALCAAARNDRNPGVRLKAVEALRGYEQDPAVRQTLLDALRADENAGVRIEAIHALRALMSASPAVDEQLRNALRERMQHDPNPYIRLQSASALRAAAQPPQ
jgi:hypothetical protein